MRAAAILGLGCSSRDLKPFQADTNADKVDWIMGMPASGESADVVLLFGGDGTVHRHLGQLVRLGLPVLVVPAGSGNDFAHSLGLGKVRDSLDAWRSFSGGSGNVRNIDLGIISSLENAGGAPSTIAQDRSAPHWARYFCCVAGVGLDGEVARHANRLPRWLRGHGGYLLSLTATVFTFSALPIKILTPAEADGENIVWTTRSDQRSLVASFANTPLYGGGMKIAPRAKMDDGLLDVCIVGSVDRLRLLRLVPTVYSGKHLSVPEVQYFQSARVRVETEHPLDVYADGEYVCRTPVEVAVQPAALKVVTR
jgi:YegS/Rv2252/BmrU family lipid kinase